MIVDAAADEGEIIWRPDPDAATPSQIERFAAYARDHGVRLAEGYQALWEWSVRDAATFWTLFAGFAGVALAGQGPVRNGQPMPETRWFPGRTLNFARHLLDGRDGTALIAVGEDGAIDEIGFDALRADVGALAAHFRAHGVGAGDTVVAVLPNIPEAVVGLLATAAVGATWSVCAPEFGPGAVVSRMRQLDPKLLLAAPGYRLGGTDRDRRAELADIVAQLPSLEQVVWVTSRAASVTAPAVAIPAVAWEEVVAARAPLDYLDVEFSHPLWVLFSSGTTGIPKGIVHGHGGALLEELKMLILGGDLRPGDRYFGVASTSWVVWNSLVSSIGAGATAVLVDGNPAYPGLDRVWRIAAETKAAVLGLGAGFVHACAKTDLAPGRAHDLGALRCVQVTGSPLSPDGFRWVYREVGDVWLASMSGGTDIVGCFVGGIPTEPVRVGYIQGPALGVDVRSWDETGAPAHGTGELVVAQPMPSMPLFLWGDADGRRYRAAYFDTYPGVWRHGDYVEISSRGIRIVGRSDSTLNRNGVRLGSADIYAVVDPLPEIAEALVVGAEIGAEDYYMPLFVTLAEGVSEQSARTAVVAAIRTHLSARYLPDEIVVMRGIPHTRTGKKLEVPVKRMLQGAALRDVVDPDAIDDPRILSEYAAFAAARSGTGEQETRS